jgi:uncharacterized protein YprB with RNaseH-like and TPR domain
VIDGIFAFVPGIGPAREKQLWGMGIASWKDFPATGDVLAPVLDARLRLGIAKMRALLDAQRWEELVALVPKRDVWRLFPHLEAEVTYLDIETTATGVVTVIGVYDRRGGPRLYVRGHNLGAFLQEPKPIALVTFNGLSFDVPILERTFPNWRAPKIHIDLRNVLRLLDERGGLKAIEARLGLARPLHLQGVNGADAIVDWEAFHRRRDVKALWRLLEYNLYDVVQMRSLAEIACERLAQRHGRIWVPQERFTRGDILLDITRTVATVVSAAPKIDPDAFDDEERRTFHTGWSR